MPGQSIPSPPAPDRPCHQDGFFIDGKLQAPQGSGRTPVVRPSDETEIGSVPTATPGDARAAIAAARAAFDAGEWGRSSPDERAALVRELGAQLDARREEIAQVVTGEAGMPIAGSRITQVNSLPGFYADLAATFPWEERRRGMNVDALVRAEPVGVLALVTPWNSPMGILLQELAPALVAGCAVVVKPPPETPLNGYLLAEILSDVGFPPGVVNIVPGDSTVGDALVNDPAVDMVSFTGSAATAKKIMAACADRLARAHLELGGKSASILLDDAPVEAALASTVLNTFVNAGQACTALSRILVPRTREPQIVDQLADLVSQLGFGDPFEPTTLVGPVITARQRDRIEQAVATARREGARVVAGGSRPDFGSGYWVAPTLLAEVTNDMQVAREETFGPVLSVIAYDDVDDAVRIANDSAYGLSGAVWSADPERATDVARRVRTGSITVNGAVSDQGLPFGGFKQSGIGRKWGVEGLATYTEIKTLNLASPG